MPRNGFAPSVQAMPGAVYSPFADRLRDAAGAGAPTPLHVGDTWLEPCEGARIGDLRTSQHPGLHRYAPTQGLPALVDALVGKLRTRNGLQAERENVLVAAGATGALANAIAAIAAPGEEVLLLAPFWPLVRGIVQAFRATPVEVPFYDRIFSLEEAIEALRLRLGPRTVALYVSSPSNPTGRVLPREWLAGFADFAREHDLWLISDEVYEDCIYEGAHFSPATLAPERTISVFSFSKSHAMAGNRVGYLCGPRALVHEAHKVGVHTAYHAPVAGQLAACAALDCGDGWLARARETYRDAAALASGALGVPMPAGSTFLFVDVASRLDDRGIDGFLSDCFEDGVLVAPGASAGRDYARWIRLCYTAVPPAALRPALARLAARLGAPGPG